MIINLATNLGIMAAKTWRIQRIGFENVLTNLKKNPIFGIWHRDIIPFSFCHRGLKISIIVSPSKDGRILANFLTRLKYPIIFGSSRKFATRALFSALKEQNSICTAVDGPLGPPFLVKPGIIYLAEKKNVPIILATCKFKRVITANSWDKTIIPLPFSKGVFIYSQPIYTQGNIDVDCKRVAEKLFELETNLHRKADPPTPTSSEKLF